MSEQHQQLIPGPEESRHNLRADCEKCFGLCCIALFFSASEGFPLDKEAGKPCLNLKSDFLCSEHQSLGEKGFKGCLAYDCFGAGQKVAQISFAGLDWRQVPASADQMFAVFLVMEQLHELLWYLTEALSLPAAHPIHGKLKSMLELTEGLTHLSPEALINLDVAAHRAEVNTLLLRATELVQTEAYREQKGDSGRRKTFTRGADLIGVDLRKFDLRGANLRGAFLIAADLREADLSWTNFLGSDFRDADLRGADLSKSVFLTQFQLNTAIGDDHTKLPSSLTPPSHWGIIKKQ